MPNLTSGTSSLQASSANAAAANNLTLTGAPGQTTYLTGICIAGAGATAGSTVVVTITGIATTMSFAILIPASATTAIPTLAVNFWPPIPSSGKNTNIVVSVPSFGAGNTAASAAAWGFLDF